MKKDSLNKITGIIAIGLMFGLVFLISWLFSRPKQKIEGPHIFYKGDTIQSLSINITGNKQDKTYSIIDPNKVNTVQFKMKTPDGEDIWIKKHDKIEIPNHHYSKPQKIIAISDIEGHFDYLKEVLRGNMVIDEDYNWIFSQGHLVVVGDIFDRGNHVTECLWLIYKLEKEAREAGGQVHVILGNHEVMALQGDHRYIHKKYKRITHNLNLDYKDLYDRDTEIGRWLRSKNAIEIIGRTLFVHGGISPELINRYPDIRQINNLIRENIDSKKERQIEDANMSVMGKSGPLWYRGYIEDPIEKETIENITNQLNIDNVVVGHTIVEEITALYKNKVYALDEKRRNRNYRSLLIEGDTYYIANSQGVKTKL